MEYLTLFGVLALNTFLFKFVKTANADADWDGQGPDWCGEHKMEDACGQCLQNYFRRTRNTRELSGIRALDDMIHESEDSSPQQCLEWIPRDQFEKLTLIGRGGFGVVFRAIRRPAAYVWTRHGQLAFTDTFEKTQEVAIKFLHKSARGVHDDFIHELKMAHSMLVPGPTGEGFRDFNMCHGITRDPVTGNLGMVTPYIPNGNLRQHIESEAYLHYTSSQKGMLLYQLARALEKLHDRGLVHRDFHSGNILVARYDYKVDVFTGKTRRFRPDETNLGVIVSDLGLAMPVDRSTDPGEIIGLLPFIAPEVLRGKPYTAKADVYSLGTIAWEMVTARQPCIHEEYKMDLIRDIVDGYHYPIPDFVPEVFREFITACWQPNPDDRPTAKGLVQIMLWKLFPSIDRVLAVRSIQSHQVELFPEYTAALNAPEWRAIRHRAPYPDASRSQPADDTVAEAPREDSPLQLFSTSFDSMSFG